MSECQRGQELLLKAVLPSMQWKLKIFAQWSTIIGQLAEHVIVARIDDHAVYLFASHPVWGQEVTFLADTIRDRINQVCGAKKIEKIIVQGFKPNSLKKQPLKTQPACQSLPAIQLPLMCIGEGEGFFHDSENTALAQALKDFLQACQIKALRGQGLMRRQ